MAISITPKIQSLFSFHYKCGGCIVKKKTAVKMGRQMHIVGHEPYDCNRKLQWCILYINVDYNTYFIIAIWYEYLSINLA